MGAVEPALLRLPGRRGVVLASGDPGFFGVVRLLRERGHTPAVFAARSSVARAFARIGRPWDDVAVVSVHGRALAPAVNLCRARGATAVLTAPGAGPAEIGAALHGWSRTLVVAEDLDGPDGRLTTVTPAEAAARTWREPNVVLCLRDPDAVPAAGWLAGGRPSRGWALADDAFDHRAGMVTKSEVRALAPARLGPGPATLVWDVGAGSGAVGIECARLGAAVIAVERRAGVEACVGAPRIVVALAALDRLAPTRAALRDYRVEGVQLAASRLAELPDGTVRLAATNPILLLWGEKNR